MLRPPSEELIAGPDGHVESLEVRSLVLEPALPPAGGETQNDDRAPEAKAQAECPGNSEQRTVLAPWLDEPPPEPLSSPAPDSVSVEADAEDPLIGQRVGPCVIHTKLGEGGMGAVYLARHKALGKDFVAKVLKPAQAHNKRRVERFFREARAAAKLEHPNIVSVQDVGTNPNGVHYMVMQYVEGQNLLELVRDQGRQPLDDALLIVRSVSRALEAMHRAGVIHRDIKPENVVVTPNGKVKVIDFGLAKDLAAQGGLTRAGALIGTPVYMAPEIGRVEVIDGRVDLYSLGLTWYFLLTGEPPFVGHALPEVIMGKAKLKDPRLKAPDLEDGYLRVLARLLARRRDERYPDAASLSVDLEALRLGRPVKAGPVPALRFTGRQDPATDDPDDWAEILGDQQSVVDDYDSASAEVPTPRQPARGATPPSDQAKITAGHRLLGRYLLMAKGDQTPWWTSFRAWDADEEKQVSVRLVRRIEGHELACRRELAKTLGHRHAHLRGLLAHGMTGDRLVLIGEFARGRTLNELSGELTTTELLTLARDAALGLGSLHDRGLVHGSLRVSSLRLDPNGRGFLGDLDLAALRRGLTQARGRGAGQGPHSAPELTEGREPSARTDVYALGSIVRELLGARGVRQPSTASDEMEGIVQDVLSRATAADPNRRYANGRDLARALNRVLRQEPPGWTARFEPILASLYEQALGHYQALSREARIGLAIAALLFVFLAWSSYSASAQAAASQRQLQELQQELDELRQR